MTTSLRAINKGLAHRGYKAELVKCYGQHYFYFIGEDVAHWESTSVLVSTVNAFTFQEWMEEYEAMAEHNKGMKCTKS